MKKMQFILTIIAGLGLGFAFGGCGDNVKPNVDSFTYDDYDMFPDKFTPVCPKCEMCDECPLPPPNEVDDCRWECKPAGHSERVWKCVEICECDED